MKMAIGKGAEVVSTPHPPVAQGTSYAGCLGQKKPGCFHQLFGGEDGCNELRKAAKANLNQPPRMP